MKFVIASAVAALVSAPAAAAVVITIEAPGVQFTTVPLLNAGVETFDARASGSNQNFVTDYGTGGVITGSYTSVDIRRVDVFGGAGAVGRYAESDREPYSIDFATSNGKKLNYFGFWWSAVDRGNQVKFYDGATEVAHLTRQTIVDLVGPCPNGYCGNPDTNPVRNVNEQYLFVNVTFNNLGGPKGFDRIVWFEAPDVGDFESDNHTVGFAIVPEPATWAMLITGFGLVGLAARRRRETSSRTLA